LPGAAAAARRCPERRHHGDIRIYAPPERRTHALSVFYTVTIGSAALAPPLSGYVGELLGVPLAIVVIALMTLATVPLAFGLLEGQRAERAA
jgi:FSR family fosmidomycin resistance protein-like MFS transporter